MNFLPIAGFERKLFWAQDLMLATFGIKLCALPTYFGIHTAKGWAVIDDGLRHQRHSKGIFIIDSHDSVT
jgi:hypothetical protein